MKRLWLITTIVSVIASCASIFAGLAYAATRDCTSGQGQYLKSVYERCMNEDFFSGVTNSVHSDPGDGVDVSTGKLDDQFSYADVVFFGAVRYDWWLPSICTNQAAIDTADAKAKPAPACAENPNYDNVFINTVQDNLNGNWNCTEPGGGAPRNDSYPSCSATRRLAINSALIIVTMLGQKGTYFQVAGNAKASYTKAINWAKDPMNFNKWATIVHEYQDAGQVVWNQLQEETPNHINSGPTNTSQDYVFFKWDQGSYLAKTVQFRDADGNNLWVLNRACGNIIGNFGGVPNIVPEIPKASFTISPQTEQPALLDAGGNPDSEAPTQAKASGGVSVALGSGATGVTATATRRFYYVKAGTTAKVYVGATDSMSQKFPSGNTSFGSKTISGSTLPVLTAGDQFCEEITAAPYKGEVNPNGSVASVSDASQTVASCTAVANKPYMQVYGGDVVVGGGVPVLNSSNQLVCKTNDASLDDYELTNDSASVVGWNRETATPSLPWTGAGNQYAVRAPAAIFDFAANYGISSSAGRPVSLAFANTTADKSDGLFGGSFGDSAINSCDESLMSASDYTSATNGPLTSLSTKLGGSSVTGSRTVFVKGDIYIDGNEMYANAGGYTSLTAIPNVKVVALGGNIYVQSGVTQLDGSYYAIPKTTGTGGVIYTCATGNVPVTDATNYNICNKQLVVNGSFVAKQVKFLRSYGSLRASGSDVQVTSPNPANNAGEVFNYGPEEWLNTGDAGVPADYKTISNLPPTL